MSDWDVQLKDPRRGATAVLRVAAPDAATAETIATAQAMGFVAVGTQLSAAPEASPGY